MVSLGICFPVPGAQLPPVNRPRMLLWVGSEATGPVPSQSGALTKHPLIILSGVLRAGAGGGTLMSNLMVTKGEPDCAFG